MFDKCCPSFQNSSFFKIFTFFHSFVHRSAELQNLCHNTHICLCICKFGSLLCIHHLFGVHYGCWGSVNKRCCKEEKKSENCAKMPKTSAFKLPSLKPDQNAPDGPRSIPELHAWQDWGYARIIDHKFERGKDLSHVN